MNIYKKSQKVLSVFAILSILSFYAPNVNAQTGRTPNPPTFPRCEDKLGGGRGDRKSESSGLHPIPSRPDFEGINDIYTLPEGNFVQCSCETSGTRGVQTNWWNLQGLPLGRVDIDAFERAGWVYVSNGSGWDLLNTEYLAKTSDVSCTPSTPTRRLTPTVATTGQSSCRSLTTNVTRGKAPLSVQFTINGTDPRGKIQEYELDTGDDQNGQEQIIKQTAPSVRYTYENPGTYNVVAWIKDSQEEWKESNACKKTIVVTETGVGGPSDELPETGLSVAGFFALIILGEAGYLLYKKFQIV